MIPPQPKKTQNGIRDLAVNVGNAKQRDRLVGFLRKCRALPRGLDEQSVALDLDDRGCPSLAALVALVALVADIDAWRGRAHIPKAALRLGEETRILRTEV